MEVSHDTDLVLGYARRGKVRSGYEWDPRKQAEVNSNKTEGTLNQKVELKVEIAKDREQLHSLICLLE